MNKLKLIIIFVLCATLLNACGKKSRCVEPIGIFAYFPYHKGDTLCFSNGYDTIVFKATKSLDGYFSPDDYCCEYLGGCSFHLLPDNKYREIGFYVLSYDRKEKVWSGEFGFDIFLTSSTFQGHYKGVSFDNNGKIVSIFPDTLLSVSKRDTIWIVKDIGVVSFTDKSSSERVYTLVQ